MLIQFSVRNYKTFLEKATLSLVASNYDKETRESENIFNDDEFNLRLNKSSVIYGANASGKSKFIDALKFMVRFAITSSSDGQVIKSIDVEPFKLQIESEKDTSEFEVIFTHNNEMFRYGFELTRDIIVSEWLYHKPKTKEIELFYREKQKFKFHPRNFTKGATLKKENLIRGNALLLSVAAQFNDKNCGKVLEWFNQMEIISGLHERGYKNNSITKTKDPIQKTKILNLLKAADLGIENITYSEFGMAVKTKEERKQLEELKEKMKEYDSEAFSDIRTTHKRYDTNKKKVDEVTFSMQRDESNGTQKFFYLTGTIIDVLENGSVLIADELDSKLHPNLVCKLISLFNSKELNPKNAQIIFNTHDTNLLNSGLFRRDQIWFIEKDRYGASKLYSLSDFKSEVRKNDNFEDNYIHGKYGAIPFLNSFENLVQSLNNKDEK